MVGEGREFVHLELHTGVELVTVADPPEAFLGNVVEGN
jgi:hypothetical protein